MLGSDQLKLLLSGNSLPTITNGLCTSGNKLVPIVNALLTIGAEIATSSNEIATPDNVHSRTSNHFAVSTYYHSPSHTFSFALTSFICFALLNYSKAFVFLISPSTSLYPADLALSHNFARVA